MSGYARQVEDNPPENGAAPATSRGILRLANFEYGLPQIQEVLKIADTGMRVPFSTHAPLPCRERFPRQGIVTNREVAIALPYPVRGGIAFDQRFHAPLEVFPACFPANCTQIVPGRNFRSDGCAKCCQSLGRWFDSAPEVSEIK